MPETLTPTLALEISLHALGYRPGWPLTIHPNTRVIDADTCRAMRCGGCHRRGLDCSPWYRGDSYRIVACCNRCEWGEEV